MEIVIKEVESGEVTSVEISNLSTPMLTKSYQHQPTVQIGSLLKKKNKRLVREYLT